MEINLLYAAVYATGGFIAFYWYCKYRLAILLKLALLATVSWGIAGLIVSSHG